jgi:predicted HicB family RNase H-like nuclease
MKKRLNIEIDDALHKYLKVMAAKNDTTITNYIIDLLMEKFGLKEERLE